MKFTLSLRAKFTLALLAASLLSLLAAGVVARSILFQQFNRIVMQNAFENFHDDITAYITTYGSWEQAQENESFREFADQRRHLNRRPPPPFPPPELQQHFDGRPPGPPPHGPGRRRGPPFRFGLTDLQGRILLGQPDEIGSQAPQHLLQAARPVQLDGKTVAWALPDPRPNYNRLDFAYLQAIRLALIAAGATAGILALVLGLFIGTRLGQTLRDLTSAITAMQGGQWHQTVKVRSKDEFGVLAGAFNRMSAELAQAYEELHKSNLQISQQAQLLKELSIRDELTGLYNRRHFNEQGAQLFAEALHHERPLTVIIGDADFFKKINDSHSHATGDEVLRRIAQILQNNTRTGDILARYGGEEFVLLLPQTSLDSALILCEKLRKQIEEYPWQDVHPDLHVTMSFCMSDDMALGSIEKQLAVADDKLYEAKRSGRNCIGYNKG